MGRASRSDELEMSSATVFTKCLSMNRFLDQGKVACNPDCQIDFLFIHDQEIESRAFRTKASPLDNNHFDQLMGNEHYNTLSTVNRTIGSIRLSVAMTSIRKRKVIA